MQRRSHAFKAFISMLFAGFVYVIYTLSKATDSANQKPNGKDLRGSIVRKFDLLSVSNRKAIDDPIDLLITFTKANHNNEIQDKFRTCVSSLFKFLSVPIRLNLMSDNASRDIANHILHPWTESSQLITVQHFDIDVLAKSTKGVITDMRTLFSYNSASYYSDSLFFLSIVLHRIFPELKRVIMLDIDLKFNANIKNLYEEFNKFSSTNIIGIARENQPIYRHAFHVYRNGHKDTRVGDPPPHGQSGFNSGVLLIDIQKMNHSITYNSAISKEYLDTLTKKYSFKGHLGDQDFFTLLSLEHEELFYVLPCTWNRQLCTWWRDNGYKSVFQEYYICEGHINIYHGNCNTEIPKLDWEQ